ncbi:MAG: hypothetical protein B7Z67_12035 [Acidiphilium sp. 21-60-14]|nr:MAG: hypothetical protein B7Z67_12035 [Acidiphilium sp. 21-60-14]OYV89427.1 MAG: hypothetical protein B7Z57_12695 [Acidiphilium sp. 37-60-79]OZB37959.1 MAG: hypothetical protein B7X48_14840 [Acidiphilium sp. 34-60-192]
MCRLAIVALCPRFVPISAAHACLYQFTLHLSLQTSIHCAVKIAGFDWDSGNWPKCGKHGVSQEEIEQVLLGKPAVMADPNPDEPRMRAIGKTSVGRYVFLVFIRLEIDSQTKLRPISARFMHQKEVDHYENQI